MALLAGPGVAGAATITVNTMDDTSATDCTLRDAIKAANTDMASHGCTTPGSGADTIQFQLPNPSTILALSAFDQISGDLTIQGPGASQLAVSGNSDHRVLSIASGATVSISGLKVSDGQVGAAGCDVGPATAGGGISNAGTLTLDRVVVSGNQASASDVSSNLGCAVGGGIFNAGTLTINQSTVTGNHAIATATGGGDFADPTGGGIDNFLGGTLTINQSTVTGNTTHANISGGASASAFGAGIANQGTATLTNSTVTDNGEITPGGKGGGIYSQSTLALRNDTLFQNVASSQGGDGGNLYNASTSASITAKNTIVAEALSSGNCGGPLPTSLGNNISFQSLGGSDTHPCFVAGNGNVFGDPVLGSLQDNGGPTQTRALGPGSAALDAGSGCEATDQRGLFRGGTAGPCDIGAFEAGASASPPPPPPPPPPPSSDTTPPDTTLGKTRVKPAKHKATFRFLSSEAGSTFLCRLDKRPFAPCRSPRTYRHLKPGRHRFAVEARDAAGNIDPSAAIKRFRLKRVG